MNHLPISTVEVQCSLMCSYGWWWWSHWRWQTAERIRSLTWNLRIREARGEPGFVTPPTQPATSLWKENPRFCPAWRRRQCRPQELKHSKCHQRKWAFKFTCLDVLIAIVSVRTVKIGEDENWFWILELKENFVCKSLNWFHQWLNITIWKRVGEIYNNWNNEQNFLKKVTRHD